MVHDVEELRAELGGQPFLDFKILGDRKVPSAKWRVAENVPSDGPVLPIGRRDQDGVARDIAPTIEKGGHCQSAKSGGSTVAECVARGSRSSIASGDKSDSVGCRLEILGIAVKVPGLSPRVWVVRPLTRSAEVIRRVLNRPGCPWLYGYDGIDRPSLQDLPRSLQPRQRVG